MSIHGAVSDYYIKMADERKWRERGRKMPDVLHSLLDPTKY